MQVFGEIIRIEKGHVVQKTKLIWIQSGKIPIAKASQMFIFTTYFRKSPKRFLDSEDMIKDRQDMTNLIELTGEMCNHYDALLMHLLFKCKDILRKIDEVCNIPEAR